MQRWIGWCAVALLSAAFVAGCGGGENNSSGGSSGGTTGATTGVTHSAQSGQPVTIAWAQWKPSDYLQTLSADFTKETGIPVKVVQIPWSDFQTKIQTGVWTGKSNAYDLIIGDSQWLGRGATEGHYEDLTDWSRTNVPWSEISPSAKKFYCEYNGELWSIPCEADAIGFAYRKDLFEDPKEKAAFKAKYKYDLAPPATWQQFRDIAEFFTRPGQKLYGAALFYAGGGSYDGITMGFDQVLWCYGGQLYDPKTGTIEGVINSPTAVQALAFYTQDLKKFTPPGSENYYFNECLKAFQTGQVAMAEDWYTFFPGLADKSQNPLVDKTGYFVSPAGPAGHYISLGGQGMALSAYSTNKDNAKKFMAWFSKRDTQAKWAKLGGLTQDTAVLNAPDFKSFAPFNAAFSASTPFLRDFYNNPKYADLLEATQINWNKAVTGEETPKQAMDVIAQKQTQVMKDAGLLKS